MGRVFVSYSHKDKQFLERLQAHLKPLQRDGIIDLWDDTRISTGDDWREEIRRALADSSAAVLLVSADFLASDFITTNELPPLLAKAESNGTAILSVIVGPCRFSETTSISRFQAENPPSKPLRAMSTVDRDLLFYKLSQKIEKLQQKLQPQEDITWDIESIRESRNGMPGYEVDLQYFRFSSMKYHEILDVTHYIKGKLLDILFSHRSSFLEPTDRPDLQDGSKIDRRNIYNAHCSEPSIVSQVMSVKYSNLWYSAGAAHPNQTFMTFNFLLDPLIRIDPLASLFNDASMAFSALQDSVRRRLYEVRYPNASGNNDYSLDREHVDSGTAKWESFTHFSFRNDGLEVLFPPYQVAGYALGSHAVVVPYTEIYSLVRPVFIRALGLRHRLGLDPRR